MLIIAKRASLQCLEFKPEMLLTLVSVTVYAGGVHSTLDADLLLISSPASSPCSFLGPFLFCVVISF
jgi:hypothetical protein